MKASAYISLLFSSLATASTLKYESRYTLSNNQQLTSFACSDGPNGLITKTGATNVAQLRTKLRTGVYITAAPSVAGWNSVNCGQCWQLRNPKNNKTISAIAVDHAAPDLVGGEDAFRALSTSGTLKEGALTVYPAEKVHSACFK